MYAENNSRGDHRGDLQGAQVPTISRVTLWLMSKTIDNPTLVLVTTLHTTTYRPQRSSTPSHACRGQLEWAGSLWILDSIQCVLWKSSVSP